MTVCIAALCQNGDEAHAVVAADRMVTLGSFIEFEHAVPKMAEPSPYAIVMVAGDTLTGVRVSQEVAEALAGSNPPVVAIAQQLAAHYESTRTARIEQQILVPRGLNFGSFYGGHAGFNPQITILLDQQLSQFNLNVELLLAGRDASGCHIYTAQNPGRPEMLHDVIGYAAIGSGAIHALQSMIGFQHTATADYHQTVFRVYASKRRAEVAPGVGRDTDMAVISAAGIHWLTADELTQLDEIYEDFVTSTTKALTDRLNAFTLGQAGNNGEGDDGEADPNAGNAD